MCMDEAKVEFPVEGQVLAFFQGKADALLKAQWYGALYCTYTARRFLSLRIRGFSRRIYATSFFYAADGLTTRQTAFGTSHQDVSHHLASHLNSVWL